jgi:hypothetical protein
MGVRGGEDRQQLVMADRGHIEEVRTSSLTLGAGPTSHSSCRPWALVTYWGASRSKTSATARSTCDN